MSDIDWLGSPMESFGLQHEYNEAGFSTGRMYHPHGEGEAQSLLASLANDVGDTLFNLLPEGPECERFEEKGEVRILRNGRWTYEALDELTLRDLPTILDTIVVLEEEHKEREREEAERVAAMRKERDRVRAKERRKLKKLGEW